MTKKRQCKKKAVFKVEDVPLDYTPEVRTMMTTILGRKVHHDITWEQAAPLWAKSRRRGIIHPM